MSKEQIKGQVNEELEKRGKAFEKEYIELTKKHGLKHVALCDFHNMNGITPVLRVMEIPKPQILT